MLLGLGSLLAGGRAVHRCAHTSHSWIKAYTALSVIISQTCHSRTRAHQPVTRTRVCVVLFTLYSLHQPATWYMSVYTIRVTCRILHTPYVPGPHKAAAKLGFEAHLQTNQQARPSADANIARDAPASHGALIWRQSVTAAGTPNRSPSARQKRGSPRRSQRAPKQSMASQ